MWREEEFVECFPNIGINLLDWHTSSQPLTRNEIRLTELILFSQVPVNISNISTYQGQVMSAFLPAVRENCCKSSSSCERFPSLERRGYDNDNISLLSRRPRLEVCASVEMFGDWKLYWETEPPGQRGERTETLYLDTTFTLRPGPVSREILIFWYMRRVGKQQYLMATHYRSLYQTIFINKSNSQHSSLGTHLLDVCVSST